MREGTSFSRSEKLDLQSTKCFAHPKNREQKRICEANSHAQHKVLRICAFFLRCQYLKAQIRYPGAIGQKPPQKTAATVQIFEQKAAKPATAVASCAHWQHQRCQH